MIMRALVLVAWLVVPGRSLAEPFLRIPHAAGALGSPTLPGAELIDSRSPRWSIGGSTGPPGTGITTGHLAVALHRGAFAAQLSLSRLGTSFYEEQRVSLGLGGSGAHALALIADVRAVEVAGERRIGTGFGAFARARVAGVELVVGLGPEGRLGERRLYPGRVRVGAGVGTEAQRAGLLVTSLGGGAPAVEAVSAWVGEALTLGVGLELVRGALRVSVGISSPVRLLVDHIEDPLAGSWTGASVTGSLPGRVR